MHILGTYALCVVQCALCVVVRSGVSFIMRIRVPNSTRFGPQKAAARRAGSARDASSIRYTAIAGIDGGGGGGWRTYMITRLS